MRVFGTGATDLSVFLLFRNSSTLVIRCSNWRGQHVGANSLTFACGHDQLVFVPWNGCLK